MGGLPSILTSEDPLDSFLWHYYWDHPVTATFTGIHDFDAKLPDWSPGGLEQLRAGTHVALGSLQRASHRRGKTRLTKTPRYPDEVDRELAAGFLEIQLAEIDSPYFYRGNPSLWMGEAIFSIVSLVTRDFAPETERLEAVRLRLRDIRHFLSDAERVLVASPPEWKARAVRESAAAKLLVCGGLMRWIQRVSTDHATTVAMLDDCKHVGDAFEHFGRWIADELPNDDRGFFRDLSVPPMIERILRRGHGTDQSAYQLLWHAERGLRPAEKLLRARIREAGCKDWAEVQARLGEQHASRENHLARFSEIWERARAAALAHDLVTWPDAAIRYVPIPEHTRDAAPNLYYLFYRSPAAFDRYDVYDYVVTPIEADLPRDEQERRLRAANDSVIALNHVIHHGGLGHHVQNWYAYRAASRIGQVAAIDAASRIGMICGGTMAEGWACYACDLMEEIGFLSPLERAAQQHTRVRLICRAIADLSLHTGGMSLRAAAKLYQERAQMPEAAATAEAVKNSMFPGTGVMYWLGTRTIHDLRRKLQQRQGAAFSLKKLHDRFLSFGAIPVPLISRLMLEEG